MIRCLNLDLLKSGFVPGLRRSTALIVPVDYLCHEVGQGTVSELILLDLSAAFDNISHGILLDCFASMSLSGMALL